MNNNVFNLTFQSDIYEVKNITHSVLSFIQGFMELTSHDAYELRIIFNELLINAVTHGNNDDRDKMVTVSVELLHSNIVRATISDEGKGFDINSLKAKLSNKESINYSEGGRGMQMVFSMVDRIDFNDCGNMLVFCKKLS